MNTNLVLLLTILVGITIFLYCKENKKEKQAIEADKFLQDQDRLAEAYRITRLRLMFEQTEPKPNKWLIDLCERNLKILQGAMLQNLRG